MEDDKTAGEDRARSGPRDPIWQFRGVWVAAVLALLSIGASYHIYNLQRTQKAVSYAIISYGPLVTVKDDVHGRLRISFDGRNVSDVQLVILKVTNTGNVPIEKSDF